MRRQLGLLLAPIACIAALAVAAERPATTPADELGLAKGSVFDVAVPDPVKPDTSDPGDRPSLPREYPGSPARVPHGIDDFLPIGRQDNLCVDCHGIAEADEGDPTPIPPSHYTDLRRAPDRLGETVAGARWVCTSCHVVLTGAEPLVGNRFIEAGLPELLE